MVDLLEALYRARLQEFRRVAAAIAGDRELGCDVVQDAFAKAVRSAGGYRGSGTLEAWVWRIVVNTARDARRSARPGDPSPSTSLFQGAGGEPIEAGQVPLALLSERQREIVFLHYYADLDYAAIADALAISPGTVGATLNAARNTLRGALQEVRT